MSTAGGGDGAEGGGVNVEDASEVQTENLNKDKIVKNGPLYVIMGWFGSCTKKDAVEKVCKSFLVEDLKLAKAALCNDPEIVGAIKGKNGTTHNSLVEDMHKCFKSLSDKNLF